MSPGASRSPALPRPERERRVLDAAEALFYARGVHAVGMDELVRASVEFDDPGHPARAAARPPGAAAGGAGPADGGRRRG